VSFLLDTNVISEWAKLRPEPKVISWLADVDEDRVFISVASVAEIRRGIELMTAGARRERLEAWLTEELPDRFEGRILSIDRGIANGWGVMMARAQKAGLTLGSRDAFFAATAHVHGFVLVTRNVRDFQPVGIGTLNPWEQHP
jgi:toxin FitB